VKIIFDLFFAVRRRGEYMPQDKERLTVELSEALISGDEEVVKKITGSGLTYGDQLDIFKNAVLRARKQKRTK